jgi:hypothetical protein
LRRSRRTPGIPGAGWGLILTYAIYLRRQDDTTLNAFMLGIGNNAVSLVAGIMVLCTVFSLMPDAREQIVGAGNEGLTFIWVPQLFARMPAGGFFMIIFFVALFFAAISSLISMIELATRVLQDGGLPRSRAIAIVGAAGFLLGIPSALSQDVFLNQDWVWGVGLMVSGLFFASTGAALRRTAVPGNAGQHRACRHPHRRVVGVGDALRGCAGGCARRLVVLGGGVYVVEGRQYLEQEWDPRDFEAASSIQFGWRGATYRLPRPSKQGDVHFVWVLGDDFEEDPLELVLVRKRSSWESLKRLAKRAPLDVLESEAEVERVG